MAVLFGTADGRVSTTELPETVSEVGVITEPFIVTPNWLVRGGADDSNVSFMLIVTWAPETVTGLVVARTGATRSGPSEELFVTATLEKETASLPAASCTAALLVSMLKLGAR